jgi:diguanylate cyclase (GGDEF)-like protein
MPFSRGRFNLASFVAVAVLGMCVLAAAVVLGVNFAVDNAVSVDARARAEDWARYFVSTLPHVDQLLATGHLDDQQASVVATAANVGNVFRFKLYNAKGDAVLESDAKSFGKTDDSDHLDDEASEVVETRQSSVSLNDGTNERNMPSLYAEAYVPVLNADGSLRAIVEAYVDQTKTAQFFKTSFETLAISLSLGIAFAFGAPTLAFLLRTKQAREVKHRVEFLARHDPMTSLLNRTSFAEMLAPRMSKLHQHSQLAIVFLDVDDFKIINDSFGHEAGDEFLKHVARSIAGLCLEDDFVARAGGDEFIVALRRTSQLEVMATVEAMIAAVREPITARGHRISGRMSAGVYLVEGAGEGVEDAMHQADLALYQAKIDGKNTVRLFSVEMEVRMRERRELEQLIRDAQSSGLFELHYQPLLDVSSKACKGFEALLRLKDKHGAFVPPLVFIPVAESIGLIDQIGKWALEEATRTAALWPDHMYVSVNLSVRQFASGHLVADVENALAASGLPGHRLELEVTESLLMENTDTVATQLDALKGLGVSIAMDDFGTGYSSLAYLWQFGFDKLKIDRSFITALDVDEKKAREILDTIIVLAHRLEMKVTAEGIETEQQAAILAGLNCDQFQGYLYGKPVAVDKIAPMLLRQVAPKPVLQPTARKASNRPQR